MRIDETKQRLQQMVEAGGLCQQEASLTLGWSIFKQFAVQTVRCADDTLSVYIGPDPRGGEQLVARFERRFEINDEEKYYDHSEAVSLQFTAPPGESLRGQSFSLSTAAFRKFESYFAAVEGMAVFQAAAALQGWTCSVKEWTTRKR